MTRRWLLASMVMLSLGLCGCTATRAMVRDATTSTLFVLNGADGPGPWYNGLLSGLRRGNAAQRVEMVNWGGPGMVLVNMELESLHDRAESRLIQRVREARQQSPNGRITLMGHSAGCGVILGALEKLEEGEQVDEVVLLAPAVSRDYQLNDALSAIQGDLHVFHSEHDQLLLKFSTSIAGTYDDVHGPSAGLDGFRKYDLLPPELRRQVVQHAYRPAWREFGHLGGHFGYRSPRFAAEVLAPIVAGEL